MRIRLRISNAPIRPGVIRCEKRASTPANVSGASRARRYDPIVSRWLDWHGAYDVPDSPLALRLAVVQQCIADALDAAAPGPVRVISMCAGDGRDLLGALDGHPRGRDVTGRLLELDPALAARARAAAP